MANIINGTGEYTVKATGQKVSYAFSYPEYASLQDAIASLGSEAEALKAIQRMEKVDANNTAREKAKVQNGHSDRKPMTESEKAEAKLERQSNKALLDAIKAQGISSLDDLKKLLG